MFIIIAYLSSFSNPKDYKCKEGQERRECSVYEYNICGIVGKKLVDVCLSLLAYRSLWLKFLVLISFPCYAGFFNHPQLDTKEHDRLKHETRDRYQSWKESKVELNPNQENKMKNWGLIHPPSPTTPASLRQFITVTYLGVKPKAVPRPPPPTTPTFSQFL